MWAQLANELTETHTIQWNCVQTIDDRKRLNERTNNNVQFWFVSVNTFSLIALLCFSCFLSLSLSLAISPYMYKPALLRIYYTRHSVCVYKCVCLLAISCSVKLNYAIHSDHRNLVAHTHTPIHTHMVCMCVCLCINRDIKTIDHGHTRTCTYL